MHAHVRLASYIAIRAKPINNGAKETVNQKDRGIVKIEKNERKKRGEKGRERRLV